MWCLEVKTGRRGPRLEVQESCTTPDILWQQLPPPPQASATLPHKQASNKRASPPAAPPPPSHPTHPQVVFNRDSSNVGPREWVRLARVLHANRERFDAFLIVHGTDTMSYCASALSLMLVGFRKPIVMTGKATQCWQAWLSSVIGLDSNTQ